MTTEQARILQLKEFISDVKNLLDDDLKEKYPDVYYKLLGILNKYNSRSPYEPDNDHS